MISKPSASCSSVMHSGGLVWIELLAIIVYRPLSRRNLPIAFISSRRAVERRQRRPRVAAPDEVDDPEQAEVARRADARVLRRQRARGGRA